MIHHRFTSLLLNIVTTFLNERVSTSNEGKLSCRWCRQFLSIAYSSSSIPGIASPDFRVFDPMKEVLKTKHYCGEEDLKLFRGIGYICLIGKTQLGYMSSFVGGTMPLKVLVNMLRSRDVNLWCIVISWCTICLILFQISYIIKQAALLFNSPSYKTFLLKVFFFQKY